MVEEYTTDWFSNHIPNWTKHLGHLVGFEAKALELGSYEGRSSVWLTSNILTHPNSRLKCVDMFRGEYYARFLNNIIASGSFNKIDVVRGDTHKTVNQLTESFDVIYIDADHTAFSVMSDACACWRVLKVGGIMIFDDYLWKHPDGDVPSLQPKTGIDAFLSVQTAAEVIHKGWQVIVRKIK